MKRITRKKSMTVRWCALMPATAAVTVEQIMQALMKKMKHCLLPDW